MSASERVNILMVDDQPGKLLSYEAILRDLGENLIKANSAREALDYLLRTDVAVVLMDVSMPDMDGFQLADMIRDHPRFQKMAIIFISAVHLSDMDRLKGYERGAVDYISVPIIPELLRAKVSVFAELHRKKHELEELNRELEQRVAERTQALSESAELLELASDAIMVLDANARVRYWNSGAESLYGWKRAEVLGRNVREVLRTEYTTDLRDIEASLTTAGKWEGNLVHHARDGRQLVMASRQVGKLDSAGNITAVLEINRDITARLQAEEALRRAERLAAMGRVAGIIAHEINNPLEAITNAFYLLQDHPSLDEEARQYARLGEGELMRLAHITKQTLSFYRESERAVPVALSEILDNVLELQSRPLQIAGIKVDKRYRCEGKLEGFPGELKQVFLNLVGNAIHAMPAGGRLRVHIHDSVDGRGYRLGVRVSICDTGTGIAPENSKRLFEPFFSTKAAKGTGLGLWISRGIVQKYEGDIQCRSVRQKDRNTTCFSVFIPTAGVARSMELVASAA
jgi:two-component system, NtrC family, sensor kinase